MPVRPSRRVPTLAVVLTLALVAMAARPAPAGEDVNALAISTGEATGTIATLTIANPTDDEVTVATGPYLIPAAGPYQPYLVPNPGQVAVAPGKVIQVPVRGYCVDSHRRAVPKGVPLPPFDTWVKPDPASVPKRGTVPSAAKGYRPRRDLPPRSHLEVLPTPTTKEEADARRDAPVLPTYPGTDRPVRYELDVDAHPTEAAGWLLAGYTRIDETYDRLKEEGRIRTPVSARPEQEREAVRQQATWMLAGALSGKPHTYEEFKGNLEKQYEDKTGGSMSSAPEPVKKQFQEGSEALWDTFLLVGTEAKVLTPVKVETPESTPTEEVPGGCAFRKNMRVRPGNTDFKVDDEYGDEAKREALRKAFTDLHEDFGAANAGGGTFSQRRQPASAWAVNEGLAMGGYAHALCKTIMLSANGRPADAVWRTEPLVVKAGSLVDPSEFTLSVGGKDCTTIVVGAVGGVLQARAGGRDPLGGTRTAMKVIEALGDLAAMADPAAAMVWSSRDAPWASIPGGNEVASAMGIDKVWSELMSKDLDAASLAYGEARAVLLGKIHEGAAADGTRQGADYGLLLAASAQSTLSGEGDVAFDAHALPAPKGAPALPTGGPNGLSTAIAPGIITDWHPTSLTAKVHTFVQMACHAQKNGIVEATLEGQLGVAMVALCICPDGTVQCESLTYSGLFLDEEGAEGKAKRASADLDAMMQDLMEDVCGEQAGEYATAAGQTALRKRLASIIANWTLLNGSSPRDPALPNQAWGSFRLTPDAFGM